MRRTLPAVLLAASLTTVVGGATGCRRDAFVVDTIAMADTLAADMIAAVEQGPTLREGVAAAEALLAARRTELEDRVIELKSLRSYQMRDGLQARWRDAFIDDVAALESMQARVATQAAADPTAAAALDALVAAYVAIVSARPADA